MNLNDALNSAPSLPTIILLFFKAFVVLLAIIYLVYSIVFLRQTVTLGKTYETKKNKVFFYISLLQVVLAFILIILSFVVI